MVWILGIINLFLIYAVIITFGACNYKNHCIEDLEKSLSDVRKQKDELLDVIRTLKKYRKMSNASRDTFSRRLIDETLLEYDEQFNELIKRGCEKYIKNELVNDDQSEN